MALTVEQFEDLVRETLNRGSTFDSQIPTMIQMAVEEIEKAHSFLDMQTFASFSLDTSLDNPERVGLPSKLKLIDWIRLDKSDSEDDPTYHYLKEYDAERFLVKGEGLPDGYIQVGREQIILDRAPDEDYPGQMLYYAYSDWPSTPDGSHWLLDNGQTELLWAATMLKFMPFMREDSNSIRSDWRRTYASSLQDAIFTDEETRAANESLAIPYPPAGEQQRILGEDDS